MRNLVVYRPDPTTRECQLVRQITELPSVSTCNCYWNQLGQVLRRLKRAPMFTAVTLLTLALGSSLEPSQAASRSAVAKA